MKDKMITYGKPQSYWNVSGTRILKYVLEVSHEGLNESKHISGSEMDIVAGKVEMQVKRWTDKWEKLEAKRILNEKKDANIDEANRRNEQALKDLQDIENLLLHTLSIDDTVDWESLKKKDDFLEKSPQKPSKKKDNKYPEKPKKLEPTFTFFEKIFSSKKERKIKEFEEMNYKATVNWEDEVAEVDKYNKQLEIDHKKELEHWEDLVKQWEKRKQEFFDKQTKYNEKIEQMKDSYHDKNVNSIIEYCELVLNNSEYPESFPKDFELEYSPDNKILIVEYQLPPIDCLPRVKEVKYIATKKELKESYISESQTNKMFDEAMYKITLRTIHELFEADVIDAIDAISFNGWVNAINPATGKEENNCILTIQAEREKFLDIELSRVDPKISFRNLKGVASSKLSTLTPVQPILQLSKTDKRFVDGYDVADKLDNSTNIAAMDWEDFEHLIRELFEKEFSSNGGEVKVTQASRDGGVDAIAFDPDPIRGGKIVIQAKRYTNTVGVAAVRDLYGTVVNEGATKGILVSTADYGPDAYGFAKDKPLTLLNGSNLLHLLEKHGHHAKIDMKEAKRILAEEK